MVTSKDDAAKTLAASGVDTSLPLRAAAGASSELLHGEPTSANLTNTTITATTATTASTAHATTAAGVGLFAKASPHSPPKPKAHTEQPAVTQSMLAASTDPLVTHDTAKKPTTKKSSTTLPAASPSGPADVGDNSNQAAPTHAVPPSSSSNSGGDDTAAASTDYTTRSNALFDLNGANDSAIASNVATPIWTIHVAEVPRPIKPVGSIEEGDKVSIEQKMGEDIKTRLRQQAEKKKQAEEERRKQEEEEGRKQAEEEQRSKQAEEQRQRQAKQHSANSIATSKSINIGSSAHPGVYVFDAEGDKLKATVAQAVKDVEAKFPDFLQTRTVEPASAVPASVDSSPTGPPVQPTAPDYDAGVDNGTVPTDNNVAIGAATADPTAAAPDIASDHDAGATPYAAANPYAYPSTVAAYPYYNANAAGCDHHQPVSHTTDFRNHRGAQERERLVAHTTHQNRRSWSQEDDYYTPRNDDRASYYPQQADYMCQHCSMFFPDEETLQVHVLTVHYELFEGTVAAKVSVPYNLSFGPSIADESALLVSSMGKQQAELLDVPGLPQALTSAFVQKHRDNLFGILRGIQGDSNSCYLDAVLSSLFLASSNLDRALASLDPAPFSSPLAGAANECLVGIVTTLRTRYFVPFTQVYRFRLRVDEHLRTASSGVFQTFNKDVQDATDFVRVLFNDILRLPPSVSTLARASDGTIQKDHILSVGLDIDLTMAGLVMLSTLLNVDVTVDPEQSSGGIIAIQFPRSGRKSTYGAIIANRDLQIPTSEVGRPRVRRWCLRAVICIETSHYVSFVRVGNVDCTRNQDVWLFLDSMAERNDDRNWPEITDCTTEITPIFASSVVPSYRSVDSFTANKNYAKRFVRDAYICIYEVCPQ